MKKLSREGIEKKKARLKQSISNDIAQLRSSCKHLEVVLWPGFEAFGTYHPVRICTNCGLEETGSWWSYAGDFWNLKDFGKSALDNAPGRTIVKVKHQHEAL